MAATNVDADVGAIDQVSLVLTVLALVSSVDSAFARFRIFAFLSLSVGP